MKRIPILIIIVLLGAIGGFVFFPGYQSGPTVRDEEPGMATLGGQAERPDPATTVDLGPELTPAPPAYQILEATNLKGAVSQFRFRVEIPAEWNTEAIGAIEAINIYDPDASGSTNLEKSQIFVRYFTANSFLTLSTVTIFEQESLTVANRPAVRYLIEKKPSAASFPNQPTWRNEKHTVTDVRESDSNPSVFYVIAKHPDLNQEIFERFLATLEVGP